MRPDDPKDSCDPNQGPPADLNAPGVPVPGWEKSAPAPAPVEPTNGDDDDDDDDPDDLEEEIEAAKDDGDVEPRKRGKTTSKRRR